MWTVLDSPVGELRLVSGEGGLGAVDFLSANPGLTSPAIPGFPGIPRSSRSSMVAQTARAAAREPGERADDEPVLQEAAGQLEAYFEGRLRDFDLPLAPVGTPFQLRVWTELRAIGYGETTSYGALAARLGMSGHGARAVGLANGRNPLPIVVPCHRVIAADGSLTGYGGGLDRKQVLLDLEHRVRC